MSSNQHIPWPQDADQHLLSIVKVGLEPLCLHINERFLIESYWGNPDSFNFHDLQLGQSANQLDFLVGFEFIEEPVTLRFVQVSPQHVAHVYIYKNQKSLYVTLFDVTDEHDYIQPIQQGGNEAQLKNFYDQQLIAKLERTQDELNRKKAEVEEISQLKSHFIASMSHEFRTPITSILGYTDILQKELSATSLPTSSVGIIKRNAYFLLNMVNNILDEARLDSGSIETSVSDISTKEILVLLESMFFSLAEKKGLTFSTTVDENVPEYFVADELRVQQILINLIGNAIKFTDQGQVSLQLSYADDFVSFRVSDTGAGISVDDQQKIFQPFQRLDSQEQGAGLGLSITQRLLEVMGGNLQLDSELNKGSIFTLSLPVQTVDSIEHEHITFAKKQVLVVEDNKDISDLLTIFLVEMGIDVMLISDGAKAYDAIMTAKPDLVIMDMNLPNKNGLDITQDLRAAGYKQPIVAFSAAGIHASKQEALVAGCDDYMDKTGINTTRLRKVLMRYLPFVSAARAEFPSKLDSLKAKYKASLPQKLMVIKSTWKSCETNQFDVVACKMLYTLTHNLAGSAGSYEFDEISHCAKAVNVCIDKDYSVNDVNVLQSAMAQLVTALGKYE